MLVQNKNCIGMLWVDIYGTLEPPNKSLEYDVNISCKGRQKTATTHEYIKKEHNTNLDDRRLMVYEIAYAVDMSQDTGTS